MARIVFLAAFFSVVAVLTAAGPTTGDAEKAEALWYLVKHMPDMDRELPISHFTETVELALEARRLFPWATKVPWKIFLNDVLPYAALAEPRDAWRPVFFNHFKDVLPQTSENGTAVYNFTTIAEVVPWMNANAWAYTNPRIHYALSTSPTGLSEYSPFEVLGAGHSSCTGLANYIVASLRSIGVPSRIAGTPHWNLGPKKCPQGDQSEDCGNHDWAEVWVDGAWSFIDPAGYTRLNTSWFFPLWTEHQVPGTVNHSIFATSWAPTELIETEGGDDDPLAEPVSHFPMVWDWTRTSVPAWDVTRRYNVTKEGGLGARPKPELDPAFPYGMRGGQVQN